MAARVDNLLQQFQALSAEDQLRVAEVIDRLTWAKRWADVCERISAHRKNQPSIADDRIEGMVQDVRREKPLSREPSGFALP